VSGVKKLLSSLLVLEIGLSTVVPPIVEPTAAQTQPQDGEIRNLLKQAFQQTKQGRSQQAIATFQQVLTLARQLQDKKNEATALLGIGFNYANIGQPQKALAYYNQSLPISKEVGDRATEATTLNNIGFVYDSIKQPQKALAYHNQSLPLAKEVGDRATEATTLSNIGFAYRDAKQPTAAIKNLEQSVEITLKLRSGLERSNRQQFLQQQRGTGVGLIDVLIAQKQPERTYQWVNLTTADLADYSRLIDAKVANPETQSAIEQWNQSNRQLENLRQELQQKFSPQLSAKINTLQAQVNQQAETISRQFPAETISRQFPEVAELFETKPTDIAMLRANISAGTVVIHPVLLTNRNVPSTIALFVLTSGKLTVTQQKIDPKAFDELVTQYRRELTDGRFKRYRATSAKLYDILIRPVEAQIQVNKVKQLSIIATGKLRYIPFETLIDSKTNKYLIEKYPVNNLTRLSTRTLPSNKQKPTLLALGNPFPQDGRSLQGAENEIKSITPVLPGSEAHLGADAKLDTFTTLAPRFAILHLATHGCFNPQGCPDLKLPANTILFRDRNLNIADAALLGLKNTDLVVLSACQPAVGANSNGEEFAGIAYLFERAGARSVIASLWLAKDEETKELMIHFYQNLKKGMTKGEALRQAKLSLIDKHPLYWSPFILIGDAR
jgi:CHAT domain-containing protein